MPGVGTQRSDIALSTRLACFPDSYNRLQVGFDRRMGSPPGNLDGSDRDILKHSAGSERPLRGSDL